MDLGTIRQINIDSEMQASYLDYAMSVIVARALPDVRDGLKPVHRRILYAMHDMGITHDKPYKKSARIVGEVLGKYHPHGDVAVYDAMVRMAQDFSLRYPLVDGQGNFGSIDGDNAAAMRYTEARLAAISTEMLADIEKGTVDWGDNFDGSLREPQVLPAALPNLIVNGASGIAVGMATNIPPHNLGEVCDALCFLIDNYHRAEDVTVEDLTQFIQGPDFPTGGIVYRYQTEGSGANAEQIDGIARAYASGRGAIVVQAKAHIEEMSRNRNRIVVTELPYMTDKTRLIERIAELARDGRLEGLTDLRDESDRTGMRINIELTRNVDPRRVLADLYKLTPLQSTFGVSLLALVDGEPRTLSLKRILQHYLEHRQQVIVRRSQYDLERAKQRAHILEGLLRAIDILDEIIAHIRASKSADAAKQGLIDKFKFDDVQAQAILDMQLRRLAALERRKLMDEYKETLKLIKELEALLASPKKVLALIRQNLVDLKARYADARRTQIADRVHGTLTAHDVLPDEDVWITLGADGSLARQRRGGEDVRGKGVDALVRTASASAMQLVCSANTRDDLFLFSSRGQASRVAVHRIPEAPGGHYADLSALGRRDRVAALLALPKPRGDDAPAGHLALGTQGGKVKRVTLADLFDQAQANPTVIGVDDGDELVWAAVAPTTGETLLVTAGGQAIRFSEEEVRPMGLPAGGIGGIKLKPKDRVVAGFHLAPAADASADDPTPPTHVALLTTLGYGKRTPLGDFPVQGRNGQGVVAAKIAAKSGELAGAALLSATGLAVCLCAAGSGGGAVNVSGTVLAPAALPEMGRATQGKSVVKLDTGVRIYRVLTASAEEPGRGESPEPAGPAAPPAVPIKPVRTNGKITRNGHAGLTNGKVASDGQASTNGKTSSAAKKAARDAKPADKPAAAKTPAAAKVGAPVEPPTALAKPVRKAAAAATTQAEMAAPITPPAAAGRTGLQPKARPEAKTTPPDEPVVAPTRTTRKTTARSAPPAEMPATPQPPRAEAVVWSPASAEPPAANPSAAAAKPPRKAATAVRVEPPASVPQQPAARTKTTRQVAKPVGQTEPPAAPVAQAPAKAARKAVRKADAAPAANVAKAAPPDASKTARKTAPPTSRQGEQSAAATPPAKTPRKPAADDAPAQLSLITPADEPPARPKKKGA